MADHHFVTVRRIPARPEAVWDVLDATDRHAEWWPGFVEYRPLTPETKGIGSRAERVVKGSLPHRLTYVTTVTKYDPPREAAYDSAGDLVGSGRFFVEAEGEGCRVTYHWDVRTTGFALNLLAPLLRPLLEWNHNQVMAKGERGLRRRLDLTDSPRGPAA